MVETRDGSGLLVVKVTLIILSLLFLSLFIATRIVSDESVTHIELKNDEITMFSPNYFAITNCTGLNDSCQMNCKNYGESIRDGYRAILNISDCVFKSNSRLEIWLSNVTNWVAIRFDDKKIFEIFDYPDYVILTQWSLIRIRRKVTRNLIRNWKEYLGFFPEYNETSSYETFLYGVFPTSQPSTAILDLIAESLDTKFHTEVSVLGTLGGIWSLMLLIYAKLFGAGKFEPLGILHKRGYFAKRP
ncbi:703_t:CDS:2 [Cetraspora pellucida]|uniref:703_t:CDS:1 n=1 Tax=Cetraspora pellucida TaxID=1433469 RepID=A0ACA9KBX9_9GLOM|nr:703_t:CDS:2 [Cetraspora pellucida]